MAVTNESFQNKETRLTVTASDQYAVHSTVRIMPALFCKMRYIGDAPSLLKDGALEFECGQGARESDVYFY